jgi:RNA polymerase sigma-70 factor (ECF subfamily)
MAISFQSLLDAHAQKAHRAAFGILRDRESAQEAAQEALLKAFAARASYDDARPFYPWLYRIVKNTCLDLLAKKKRRPQVELFEEAMAAPGPLPEEEVRRKEDAERLMVALADLSQDHQEAINLRHFQELSYAEMAEILEVSEGTVMSRLFRARKALAAQLNQKPKQKETP